MLVVTRKVGERIVVGDNVVITVVRIAGGMVRIGVEAPNDYTIVRRELINETGETQSPSPNNRSTGK
jgi:carbon storage regulator